MPIHTMIHANTCMRGENPCAAPKQYWYVSGMYRGMYWHILACIWHVMACIQFRCSTRVFAPHTSIGMYFGMYWYVFSTYWACIQIQYTLIPTWRPILMQVLWYVLVCIKFVLICMSTYMLVFDHKLIVNTPTWCHTALESTFNAIFTVDTAEMSLGLDFQSTL